MDIPLDNEMDIMKNKYVECSTGSTDNINEQVVNPGWIRFRMGYMQVGFSHTVPIPDL